MICAVFNSQWFKKGIFILIMPVFLSLVSCGSDGEPAPSPDALDDDCLCLNDIQLIGSHNSYKIAIEQPILNFITQLDPSLADGLEYEHPPITSQLDLGLRSLEFDVFYDPDGGHYVDPEGLNTVRNAGVTPLPYDENNDLSKTGLKMFHIQDVDFRSHHLLFSDGLQELKEWSDQNSGHTPIIVLINAKDASIPLTRNPVPFDVQGMKLIDDEISAIFNQSQLITPDLVRGSASSLEDAVLTSGWPELEQMKGRILFILDENVTKTNLYLSSFPGLQNAVLFVNVAEGNPESGFHIINDPISNLTEIQRLVGLGYMVRTRADSETAEARLNDTRRFQAAISSRAQVISTDYYIPSTLFDSDYQVIFSDSSYERIQSTQ